MSPFVSVTTQSVDIDNSLYHSVPGKCPLLGSPHVLHFKEHLLYKRVQFISRVSAHAGQTRKFNMLKCPRAFTRDTTVFAEGMYKQLAIHVHLIW
jgi:hypothetical protein